MTTQRSLLLNTSSSLLSIAHTVKHKRKKDLGVQLVCNSSRSANMWFSLLCILIACWVLYKSLVLWLSRRSGDREEHVKLQQLPQNNSDLLKMFLRVLLLPRKGASALRTLQLPLVLLQICCRNTDCWQIQYELNSFYIDPHHIESYKKVIVPIPQQGTDHSPVVRYGCPARKGNSSSLDLSSGSIRSVFLSPIITRRNQCISVSMQLMVISSPLFPVALLGAVNTRNVIRQVWSFFSFVLLSEPKSNSISSFEGLMSLKDFEL